MSDERGSFLKPTGLMEVIMFIIVGMAVIAFVGGGGFGFLIDLVQFLKKIPVPVWVVLGIMFLFGRRK